MCTSHLSLKESRSLSKRGECVSQQHHIPTSKQSSLIWKHKNLLYATNTNSKTSAGKAMLMPFFDVSGFILVELVPKGKTINAARYIDTLMKLHTNIKNHWKRRICAGIVLLHDNTRFYMVALTHRCRRYWNSKFSHIQSTARILISMIIKFLVPWRNFWSVKVFLLTKRSKKQSRNGCYKLGQNFGAV